MLMGTVWLCSEDEKLAQMPKLPVSISAVASNYGGLYDPFFGICSHNTYLPSALLRDLVAFTPEYKNIDAVACKLAKIGSAHSFQFHRSSSETSIVDVMLEAIVDILQQLSKNQLTKRSKLALTQLVCNVMKPEHCLTGADHLQDFIFLGTEAKGLEASTASCLVQLHAVCSVAALKMLDKLSYDEVVVPGIALSGEGVQVFGMYLLPPSFPVMVALSPALKLSESKAVLDDIALWLLRCLRSATAMRDRLAATLTSSSSGSCSSLQLSMKNLFFKPVRPMMFCRPETETAIRSPVLHRLNDVMSIFKALSDQKEATNCVLFPVGVVFVPCSAETFGGRIKNIETSQQSTRTRKQSTSDDQSSTTKRPLDNVLESSRQVETDFRRPLVAWLQRKFPNDVVDEQPLIVFENLTEAKGWRTAAHRPHSRLVRSFEAALTRAVQLLNAAGIAHLDLRPANILWREKRSPAEVEIRLIDFDDSLRFGSRISPEWITEKIKHKDRRFPFRSGDGEPNHVTAGSFHNLFFLIAVMRWMKEAEDEEGFGDFMASAADGIYDEARDAAAVETPST